VQHVSYGPLIMSIMLIIMNIMLIMSCYTGFFNVRIGWQSLNTGPRFLFTSHPKDGLVVNLYIPHNRRMPLQAEEALGPISIPRDSRGVCIILDWLTIKWKTNSKILQQFQNLIEKIVETGGKIDTLNTQIHDRPLSWLGTPNTQIHDRPLS
jgi:hypothetical protein